MNVMRNLSLCVLLLGVKAGQPPPCGLGAQDMLSASKMCVQMCAARAAGGLPLPFPCTAVFCNMEHHRCDVKFSMQQANAMPTSMPGMNGGHAMPTGGPQNGGQQGGMPGMTGGQQGGMPTSMPQQGGQPGMTGGNECRCYANEPKYEKECERNPARISPKSCMQDGTRTGTMCHWGPSENPECQGSSSGPQQGPKEMCPREMMAAKAACGQFIMSKCPSANTHRAKGECFIEHRSIAPPMCQNAGAAVFKCMHERESEQKCMDNYGKETMSVCIGDISKLCPRELTMGFRPVFGCMMANQQKVSHMCAMESRSLVACVQCGNAKRNAFDQCMEAFMKVCKDTKEGEEEKCFRANQSKFPMACQTAASRAISSCKREEQIREQTDREVAGKVRQAVYRAEQEDRRREDEQSEADRRREADIKMKEDWRERSVTQRETIQHGNVQRMSTNPMGAEGTAMRHKKLDQMPGVLDMLL